MPRSGLSKLAPFCLLLCPLCAAAPTGPEALALDAIQTLRSTLQLDQRTTFTVRKTTPDTFLNGTDVRIDQYYQGVRVLGGEAIVHLRNGRMRTFTDRLKRQLNVDAMPTLTASEALAIAQASLASPGRLTRPPHCELVVARLQPGPGARVQWDVLVYHLHLELEQDGWETAHLDELIDAHTGAMLKQWDSLETVAATGIGHSQYNGKVAVASNSTASGFELRDQTRGKGGNSVLNLNHGKPKSDDGDIYVSTSDTWGDGRNYDGNAETTSLNGETAAVDAAYGLQWTWDYYKNVHGRNGIDGKGTATTLRVHFGDGFDNAFWDDSCFCMTFGDGSTFKSLESLDVIGHEVSHGVCSSTANLEYTGESGGLNEANSDINGTMVEFYARAGSGCHIGDQGGNWTIGEQLVTPKHPAPLRYMYKPSKDGKSPDAWSSDLGDLNVHRSSGPMNRCFYFLSQGASAEKASDFYSPLLPGGMKGLGNDASAHIWYRALTTYMTSGTDYAEARQSVIDAAKDLHGAGSPEEIAAWNAFHGINVGEAWKK